MTEDEINDLTAEVKTCLCGALIEQMEGGGYSYWLHVKRMRISYDHAAIPALPLQITPTTRQFAEEYRSARDVYFDMDPDVNSGPYVNGAQAAYDHAARVSAEQMLFEIDRTKEAS